MRKPFAAHSTKAVHRTFVPLCCNLGLFLGSYVLDCRNDLRGIRELGEPVLLRAMCFPRLLDILPPIAEAWPLMMPGALVVDITTHALQGVGTRTVRQSPESRTPRVTGAPRLDGLRLRPAVVIADHRETRVLLRWGRVVQQGEECPPYAMLCTRAEPLQHGASRQRLRSSRGVFCVWAWRQERVLRTWPPPCDPHLRQEVASACIRVLVQVMKASPLPSRLRMAYPPAMDTHPSLPQDLWEQTPSEVRAYIVALEARVTALESMVQALQEQKTVRSKSSSTKPRATPPVRPRVIPRRLPVPNAPGASGGVVANQVIPARRARSSQSKTSIRSCP
jgi:hypothetical protein